MTATSSRTPPFEAPESREALETLMRDFAWAVHDFQRLAHAVSLLVPSIAPGDDLEASSFSSDIDTLTNPGLRSTAGHRVAETLTDEDRRALRSLKGTRDDLVHRFFLTHRVEGGTVPEGATRALKDAHAQVRNGQAILERLLTALSTG